MAERTRKGSAGVTKPFQTIEAKIQSCTSYSADDTMVAEPVSLLSVGVGQVSGT